MHFLKQQQRAPHRLLDTLIELLGVSNDAALSRALQLPAPSISKIRHGKVAISSEVIIRIHESCSIPIAELKDLAGQ